ncbi:hypothetical protein [Apilactobacillus xinyiensis]|uniref:hypothetical protein n=1 Tax=Apilactobacillus xinyiensis TaxID=2841032 RepID=UPI00200DC2DA|nr:hypothetical protein [Apilactobacillus xinyiensis]MCL0319413.1 hypothetical protein [Apilactobacillus xinyiensis]
MNKNTANFIEDLLRDYPHIPRYIARKKQEIKYPYRPNRDDNVGGGSFHGGKDARAELILLKIEDSNFISQFLAQKDAIEDALLKCEPAFLEVVKEYYFDNYNTHSFRKIGMDHGYANNSLYKQRAKLLKNIMKNLGMHHVIERDEYKKEMQLKRHQHN